MLSDFRPGDLVASDRPDGIIPQEERKRVGVVLGRVPPGHPGNGYAITQLLVLWTGPWRGKPFTVEPDHRLQHI